MPLEAQVPEDYKFDKWDSNNVSLDSKTDKTFTENVVDRFVSYGWNVEVVKNGVVKSISAMSLSSLSAANR